MDKSRRLFYTGALISLGLVLFFVLRIVQEAHILRSVMGSVVGYDAEYADGTEDTQRSLANIRKAEAKYL